MPQERSIRLALLGAAGGAGAGLVVVFVMWLLLPRGTEPNPVLLDARATETDTTADSTPAVTPPTGTMPHETTAASPTAAATSPPAAAKVRTDDQAEIYAKLKKIGLAMHVHNDNFRTFAPPMAAPGDEKATRLSWRVHILPYLDQKPLYEEFYLDEPWDSKHNTKLLDKMPDVFRIGSSAEPVTRFRVFTGPRVMFGPGKKLAIRDVTDGMPNTIHAVVVGPDRAVPWTKPDEMELDEKDPVAALGTLPDGVFDCLMGDGQSLTLPADVAPEIVVALATPAGGEIVDGGSLRRGIGVKTKKAAAGVPPASDSTPASAATPTAADPRQPKLVQPTETPKLRETVFKLYQISLAITQYAEKNGSRLPIAGDPDTFAPQDRPKLSWRVHLLPYLKQQPLYNAFHRDEPWDSPHNLPLVDQMPDIYRSVSSEVNVTRMQVLYGDKMLFGPGFHNLSQARRGVIFVVHAGWDRAVPWTKPEDIAFDPAAPLAGLGSIASEPIPCAAAIDRTLVLPPDIDPQTFAALVMPGSTAVVDWRRYAKEWHEVPTAPSSVTQDVQKRNRQMTKLKDISHAMHNYHDAHGQFPPIEKSGRFDSNGRPFLSWRVQMLPFLDQGPLYNRFKLNESWDSPNNRPLADMMPDMFRDEDDPPTSTTTRFVVMTGAETPFASRNGPRIRDFRDGTSTTILVVRVGKDKAVPWTSPDDAAFNPAAPLEALGSLGSEELMFLTVDGAIKRVKPTVPAELFRALVTVQGREVIDLAALDKSDFEAALKSAPSATSNGVKAGQTERPANPTPASPARTAKTALPPPPKASAAAITAIAGRAQAAGRRGDWQAAAAEFARLIEAKPIEQMTEADHHHLLAYAPVLVQLGQCEQYETLCRAAIARFGATTTVMIAERTAKMCLLAEPPQEVIELADKLAARAIELGQGHQYLTYFEFARALAHYRAGRWKQALEWSVKSQQHNQNTADYIWFHVALNHVLQAMIHHQLNDAEKAEQALKTADEIIAQKLPKLDSGDLSVSWHDWLTCDLLRREAAALNAK